MAWSFYTAGSATKLGTEHTTDMQSAKIRAMFEAASGDLSPCEDCTGLVGATRKNPPHEKLLAATSETKGVYKCDLCDCRWLMSDLGWARLVD